MAIKLFRQVALVIVCLLCSSIASASKIDPMNIIITGHTCAGKTSLINELEKRGYRVVHEVATAVLIDEYAKLDEAHPENAPHNLPSQIENLQFKIFSANEKAYQEAMRKSLLTPPRDNIIIFDRSEFDTYVYMHVFYPPDKFTAEEWATADQIINQALQPGHYSTDVIFCEIVPPEYFNGILSNKVRHESYDQAKYIGDKISQAHEGFGHTLHKIGFKDTISQKADQVEAILQSIRA